MVTAGLDYTVEFLLGSRILFIWLSRLKVWGLHINSQKLLDQFDSFIVKSIITKEINLMLGSLVSFKTWRLGFPPTFPLLSGGLYHDGFLGWGL